LRQVQKRDFFLDKQREKAKLEAEMKLLVTLRQLIPAGEAKPIAPLSVILSQYYLNLVDFCREFNEKTKHYEPGVLLPSTIRKGLRAKEYKLTIKSPSLSFLLAMGRGENPRIIDLVILFDILRYKAAAEKKLLQPLAWELFGTIRQIKLDE